MNASSSGIDGSRGHVGVATPMERNNYLAMVAHELRDPLMPILNAASVLLSDPATSPLARRSAALIERQARILNNLIDDLMNVTRVHAGKLQLNCAHVSMSEIVHRCLDTASLFCERRSQTLRVIVAPISMKMNADAARLIQALRNLIVNASKFSPPGSEIVVRAEREGNEAIVAVHDDGIGIEHAELEPIFSLFTQAANGATIGAGGLGIGLFLARQFAEAHGGSLLASSAGLGRGSTFTLRVPCLPMELHADDTTVSKSSDDRTRALQPHSIRTKELRGADDR